jgi:hypothetical protein
MTETHLMASSHPITPPPELVQQWRKSGPADAAINNAYECHIATQAARWGADQELEACCEWLDQNCGRCEIPMALREARRPKPTSLKQQALTILEDTDLPAARYNILLRALEALPDD